METNSLRLKFFNHPDVDKTVSEHYVAVLKHCEKLITDPDSVATTLALYLAFSRLWVMSTLMLSELPDNLPGVMSPDTIDLLVKLRRRLATDLTAIGCSVSPRIAAEALGMLGDSDEARPVK